MIQLKDFSINNLGDSKVPSPLKGIHFVDNKEHILFNSNFDENKQYLDAGSEPPRFDMAGPREKIFFDPSDLACGIVTCGGLCPGINDVIRAIVLSLTHHYGVKTIYGFQYGYEGLVPKFGHQPVMLTTQVVSNIYEMGGIMLASSRGNQDVAVMVDTLERMKIGILFCIGGDGTQRVALAISEEALRRGLKLSVIGIPKTIDNDISCRLGTQKNRY